MIRRPFPCGDSSPSFAHRPVLVAVRNACEEIVAGLGSALCTVRTLDGLACDVRAGELLLLVGGVASGAISLLSALQGVRTRGRAQRLLTPGVRIRRAMIPFAASEAIIAGWKDALSAGQTLGIVGPGNSAPLVYLLRVRPAASARPETTGAFTLGAWRAWAEALQRQGSAIVLARHDEPRPPIRRAVGTVANSDPVLVRETPPDGRTQIRTLTLHAGRIVRVEPGAPKS